MHIRTLSILAAGALCLACGTDPSTTGVDVVPGTDDGGTDDTSAGTSTTTDTTGTEDTSDDTDTGDVEACASDDDCNDDLFCNGIETCSPDALESGPDGCIEGIPPKGVDPNPVDCQVLSECDEETDAFTLVALAAGDPCDDGIACTKEDVCAADGSCKGAPDDVRCDDGLFCTGVESCNTVIGCLAGTAPVGVDDDPSDCLVPGPCEEATQDFTMVPADIGKACDDAIDCTFEDGCTGAGTCDGKPNDGFCSDDLFCNGAELCDVDSGGCTAGPPAMPPEDPDTADCQVFGACDEDADEFPLENAQIGTDCDDGIGCTLIDICDDAGTCAGSATDSECDDGQFCNGAETCSVEAGDCVNGEPPAAPDDPNLSDCMVYHPTCNPDLGAYELVPAAFGSACDDGVGCTVESCIDGGVCQPIADPATCIDANLCNGTETCDVLQGCQPGTPLVCDNNDVCDGVETCEDLIGCVDADPLQPPADPDPDDCMVVSETCDATDGYTMVVAAADSACDDGDACTTDACNGTDGTCQGTLACDNDLFCDGVETCGATGCEAGTPPEGPADDPDDCVIPTCDEATDTFKDEPVANDTECVNGGIPGSCVDGSCVTAT